MNKFTNWLEWGAVAALLAVALGAVYSTGAHSRDAEIAQLKADRANLEKVYANLALEAQKQISEEQAAKQQAVAAADQRATQEVADAKRKYQNDLAAVRAGALGVRLNGADCAAPGGAAMPAAAGAAGLADGTAGGLPPGVAESVLDLRTQIEYDAAKIDGLQRYIRAVAAPVK
jgi:phage protein D